MVWELSDRTQCVVFDGVKSCYLDITKGFLPGSILGTVLLNIYINYIGLSAKTCNMYLYADDTVMYNCPYG